MTYVQLALALFKLVNSIFEALQQTKWYNDGRAAADAEANEEQRKRIEAANAARDDADQFASGGVRDPRQRD